MLIWSNTEIHRSKKYIFLTTNIRSTTCQITCFIGSILSKVSYYNMSQTTYFLIFSKNVRMQQYSFLRHLTRLIIFREQTKGQLLNISDPNMIKSTNFDAENPTKILVHDWLGSFYEKECFCTRIAKGLCLLHSHAYVLLPWTIFKI